MQKGFVWKMIFFTKMKKKQGNSLCLKQMIFVLLKEGKSALLRSLVVTLNEDTSSFQV
jgi:hypothetical protein